MQHLDALKLARSLLRRPTGSNDEPLVASPDLLTQAPDLAKESAYNRNASAWAAGGQPTD